MRSPCRHARPSATAAHEHLRRNGHMSARQPLPTPWRHEHAVSLPHAAERCRQKVLNHHGVRREKKSATQAGRPMQPLIEQRRGQSGAALASRQPLSAARIWPPDPLVARKRDLCPRHWRVGRLPTTSPRRKARTAEGVSPGSNTAPRPLGRQTASRPRPPGTVQQWPPLEPGTARSKLSGLSGASSGRTRHHEASPQAAQHLQPSTRQLPSRPCFHPCLRQRPGEAMAAAQVHFAVGAAT
mmetsp:Transcript_4356/g.13591  ORF Transcript_4356/g.13591 Transcript_4356/m.13591 type:complete len:241 (+) Transcript_4356:798-1520(+)